MAPARGFDFFIQANYIFSEKTEFYIRYKNEEKDKKLEIENKLIDLPWLYSYTHPRVLQFCPYVQKSYAATHL